MSYRSSFYLSALSVLILCTFCIPVHAYSPGATQWYEQGHAAIAAGNNTAAMGAFDQAIVLEPTYFEAWDGKADALNRDGQFSDALSASDRALGINPEYVQGWINRGQILYNIGYYYEDQKNDLTKANEYYNQQLLAFEKAISLDPRNTDALFNKGYALAGMKRYDEAIAAFDKVKEINPEYPKIDQNKKIAQHLRDQAIPDYMKFLPVLAMIAVVIIGIVLWSVFLREKKDD